MEMNFFVLQDIRLYFFILEDMLLHFFVLEDIQIYFYVLKTTARNFNCPRGHAALFLLFTDYRPLLGLL